MAGFLIFPSSVQAASWNMPFSRSFSLPSIIENIFSGYSRDIEGLRAGIEANTQAIETISVANDERFALFRFDIDSNHDWINLLQEELRNDNQDFTNQLNELQLISHNNESRIKTFEPSVIDNGNRLADLEERVNYIEPAIASFDPSVIANLETLLADQAQQIIELKDELAVLRESLNGEIDGPPADLEPIVGQFNGEEPIDAYGYTQVSVTVIGLDVSGLDVYYSDDQLNWTWQHELGDGPDGYQPSYVMPVLGRYYKVVNEGDQTRDITYYLE